MHFQPGTIIMPADYTLYKYHFMFIAGITAAGPGNAAAGFV
jgi:hypothetical protein